MLPLASRGRGRAAGPQKRARNATFEGLHRDGCPLHDMHMRRIFLTDEAKKKLWRPCREARALGL